MAPRKTTPLPNNQVLCLTMADVSKILFRVNLRKAVKPDNNSVHVLRRCADQLTDIFNDSLYTTAIPMCFKITTVQKKWSSIFPSHTHTHPSSASRGSSWGTLTHSCPPQRTSCSFYKLLKPLNDAITTSLHLALTHLDKKNTYRKMFVIQHHHSWSPARDAETLGLNTFVCNWILGFLTERPQSVKIGSNISSIIIVGMGPSHSCLLSPLLFTMLTNNSSAMQPQHQFCWWHNCSGVDQWE